MELENKFENEKRVVAREHEARIGCVDGDDHFKMCTALDKKKLIKICKEEGTTLEKYLDYVRSHKDKERFV